MSDPLATHAGNWTASGRLSPMMESPCLPALIWSIISKMSREFSTEGFVGRCGGVFCLCLWPLELAQPGVPHRCPWATPGMHRHQM